MSVTPQPLSEPLCEPERARARSKKRTSKQASKGLEIEALHHKFFTQWGGWGPSQEGTQIVKMNMPPLTKTLGFSGKHAKIRGGAPIRVGSAPFL